jgi:sodium-coupled neutral amino acid transporter 11
LDLFKIKERGNAVLNNVTYALLAIVTFMASRLTDLGMVASVGGATFGTALVFVYPCIMFLKSQGKKSGKETALTKLIAALGVVMGIIGTNMALKGSGGH